MSKKPQPQAKQNPKHKIQIVDQQNQPFIKSLQKRIRNINKKLTQIDQLSKKDNLKPQQIEKINRKEALLEQRESLESTIIFYKESIAQNAQQYRNIQLRQLEVLARGIVIAITNPNFPQNSKLQKVSNALNSVQGSTFNQAVSNLFNTLKQFSNDRKLQKLIQNYSAQNGEKAIDIPVVQHRHVQRQVHTDQVVVVVEQVTNQKGQNLGQIQVIQKIHDGVVENVQVHVFPNPQFKGENPLNQIQQAQQTPAVTPQNTPTEATTQTPTPKTELKEDRPQKTRGQYHDKKSYKSGNQGQRKEYKKYEDRPKRQEHEKKQYKPKYQQKQQNNQDDSDSSSQPQTRNFKRQQIRQLEDQGFIVVGKPKPKARDQQQVYQKQHGKKYHHHHTQPTKN